MFLLTFKYLCSCELKIGKKVLGLSISIVYLRKKISSRRGLNVDKNLIQGMNNNIILSWFRLYALCVGQHPLHLVGGDPD